MVSEAVAAPAALLPNYSTLALVLWADKAKPRLTPGHLLIENLEAIRQLARHSGDAPHSPCYTSDYRQRYGRQRRGTICGDWCGSK